MFFNKWQESNAVAVVALSQPVETIIAVMTEVKVISEMVLGKLALDFTVLTHRNQHWTSLYLLM